MVVPVVEIAAHVGPISFHCDEPWARYCKKEIWTEYTYCGTCTNIHHVSITWLYVYTPPYLQNSYGTYVTLHLQYWKGKGIYIHLYHKLLHIRTYTYTCTHEPTRMYPCSYITTYSPSIAHGYKIKICRSMSRLLWPVRQMVPWPWLEFYS